jgi:hypothetical protein
MHSSHSNALSLSPRIDLKVPLAEVIGELSPIVSLPSVLDDGAPLATQQCALVPAKVRVGLTTSNV